MTTLVNLTPHPLNFYLAGGVLTLPPSGQLARCRNASTLIGEAQGLPIYEATFDEVTGLPDPQPDTLYITSSLVQQGLRKLGIERPDVVSPGTGPNDGAIRANGQVIGVTRLVLL